MCAVERVCVLLRGCVCAVERLCVLLRGCVCCERLCVLFRGCVYCSEAVRAGERVCVLMRGCVLVIGWGVRVWMGWRGEGGCEGEGVSK